MASSETLATRQDSLVSTEDLIIPATLSFIGLDYLGRLIVTHAAALEDQAHQSDTN
jgi:hypothetical protein